MKLTLISLVVFAVAYGSVLPRQITNFGMNQAFNKVALLPTDYLSNNTEVQEALKFLQSKEFKNLLLEYKEFLRYLRANGLNIYNYLQKLHQVLDLPDFKRQPRAIDLRRGKGFRGLNDDIKAILPLKKIKALYYELLETNPAFAHLVNVIKGIDLKSIVIALRANPQFAKLIQRAKDYNVDIKLIVDLLNKMFGRGIETKDVTFGPPAQSRELLKEKILTGPSSAYADVELIPTQQTYGLHDDMQDFLNLVPVERIVKIAMDYLAKDSQVQQVFKYAQSDEFKKLVQNVDRVEDYIKVLNYLQFNGFDIYRIVNSFHDFLGLENLPVPPSSLVRRGQGICGLIDDILAVLPTEQIIALFHKKLETSPEFAKLINLLKGEEFKGLIQRLCANPTVQEITARVKSHGIDVAYIAEILNKIFGWGIETKDVTFGPRADVEPTHQTAGIHDDLQDFLNLLPGERIVKIAMDYLAKDSQVQQVFKYAQSDEFKKLVQKVDRVEDYIKLLNFLQFNGFDIYRIVNSFHDFLGLENLPLPSSRRSQGMRGLIDDILAVLPTEQIKDLFYKKLASSPEFAKLVNLLRGKEFAGLIERLCSNPTIQKIVSNAKSNGIDVGHIIKILRKMFGLDLQY